MIWRNRSRQNDQLLQFVQTKITVERSVGVLTGVAQSIKTSTNKHLAYGKAGFSARREMQDDVGSEVELESIRTKGIRVSLYSSFTSKAASKRAFAS